jgi:hypothetical protein
MRAALLIALLAVVGCADEPPPGPTLDGTDPVQSDADLAPDAGLQPDAGIEPESDLAPDPALPPEETLQPDSSGTL